MSTTQKTSSLKDNLKAMGVATFSDNEFYNLWEKHIHRRDSRFLLRNKWAQTTTQILGYLAITAIIIAVIYAFYVLFSSPYLTLIVISIFCSTAYLFWYNISFSELKYEIEEFNTSDTWRVPKEATEAAALIKSTYPHIKFLVFSYGMANKVLLVQSDRQAAKKSFFKKKRKKETYPIYAWDTF